MRCKTFCLGLDVAAILAYFVVGLLSGTRADAAEKTALSPEKLRGQIAYLQNGDLWVVHPDTRQRHLLIKGQGLYAVNNIAFSPDRTQIALAEVHEDMPGSGIFVMRWDGQQRRRLTSHGLDRARSPRWSPDGKSIAYTLGTQYIMGGPPKYSEEVHIVDVENMKDRRLVGTIDPNGPAAFDPYWSRDGKSLFFTYYPGALDYEDLGGAKREKRIMNRDGSHVRPFEGNEGEFIVPGASRDGKRLAALAPFETYHYDLNIFRYPKKELETHIWRNLDPVKFLLPFFDASGTRLAVQGDINLLAYDAEGYLDQASLKVSNERLGIYVLRVDKTKPPRLLVERAQLIDWL